MDPPAKETTVNDDTGKKVLIGGGLVVLGAFILNQIYTSGFQAGLAVGGGDPRVIERFGHGGFPFGLFVLIGIGVFVWWKVTNGGKRSPGGFFGHRRGMYDDRRQSWPQPYQQHFGHQPYGQQYGAPQQPSPSQAPGAAPQPPVNYGAQGAGQQPPASYSPPTAPAPGHPQPDLDQPPAAADPNKPAV
jgi:hypothetical protein